MKTSRDVRPPLACGRLLETCPEMRWVLCEARKNEGAIVSLSRGGRPTLRAASSSYGYVFGCLVFECRCVVVGALLRRSDAKQGARAAARSLNANQIEAPAGRVRRPRPSP